MTWMNTTICPFCGADGFEPDCDSADVGVGVIEGNLRGECRVCEMVAEAEHDDVMGWEAKRPLRAGDRVSVLVAWPNGQEVRTAGRYILTRDGEVYIEADIGNVVGPATSLEREDE